MNEPAPSVVCGWDVGGAHIKLAVAEPARRLISVSQHPFELWRRRDELQAQLRDLLSGQPTRRCHRVTMTGEMADCYPNRTAGVEDICAAFSTLNESVQVFNTGAGLVTLGDVAAETVAAMNWLAPAELIAKSLEPASTSALLVVDVGSTTTDLTPVLNGRVETLGLDDRARLRSGALVYTGAIRTPVHAVSAAVPFQGVLQPIIPEHFATMLDIHRLSGGLDQLPHAVATADGADADEEGCARRLARVLGVDLDDVGVPAIRCAAQALSEIHHAQITQAVLRIAGRYPGTNFQLVAAGAGAFMVEQAAVRLGLAVANFHAYLEIEDPILARNADICAPASALALMPG